MTTAAFAAPCRAPWHRAEHRPLVSPRLAPHQKHSARRVPSSCLRVESEVLPDLRALSAATRRGRRAGARERAEAEALVRRLEAVSRAPPLLASKINELDGEWHLIYFASGARRRSLPELQGVTIRASDADPGARNITQTIFLDSMRAVNAAVFSLFGIPCEVNVDAKIRAVDSYTIEVIFQTARFSIGWLPVVPFPLTLVNARGTLRTSYLSDRVRIGRGGGSLYVLVKEL